MVSVKRILLFIILYLVFRGVAVSQYQFSIKDDTTAHSAGDLSILLANSNFIKNNEYFNKIVEGYTLFGFWATPSLLYQITEKSDIEGGVHLLKFDGRDQFFKTLPVFRFNHHFNQNIEMVFGTIKNNSNHLMPAMMYDPERFYFNQTDNGIQFLISSKHFSSDIWISWDKFSFYGDSIQEEITFGTSNYLFFHISNSFNIKIPVHTIITHKGGQLIRPKKPIETLINLGSGVELEGLFNNGIVNKVVFAPRFFVYNKNSSAATQPFNDGWAMYPSASIQCKWFLIEAGYWYSDKFIGPRGEALYQPVSLVTTGFVENNRELLIGKIGFDYDLSSKISASAGFEGYYDNNEKIFDYNFSFHINCLLNLKLGNYAISK